MVGFNTLDLDINLSDHFPIMTALHYELSTMPSSTKSSNPGNVYHFRWDHAPLGLYYEQIRLLLQPILDELSSFEEKHFSEHRLRCRNILFCCKFMHTELQKGFS